jgi:hypothetical protein
MKPRLPGLQPRTAALIILWRATTQRNNSTTQSLANNQVAHPEKHACMRMHQLTKTLAAAYSCWIRARSAVVPQLH